MMFFGLKQNKINKCSFQGNTVVNERKSKTLIWRKPFNDIISESMKTGSGKIKDPFPHISNKIFI